MESALKDYASLKTYDTEGMGSIYFTESMWKLLSAYVKVRTAFAIKLQAIQ